MQSPDRSDLQFVDPNGGLDELAATERRHGKGALSLLLWLSRLAQTTHFDSDAIPKHFDFTDWPPILDRYAVESLVGIGGFGAVFCARDLNLGRRIALKLAWPGVLLDPNASRRFIEEPRIAASLRHRGIVEVYDSGEVEMLCFIALELVEGPTLATWLKHNGRAPIQQSVAIIRDVARAMQAAHERGIVHRDLKPSNILLRPVTADSSFGFEPVVTDFGSARGPQAPTKGTRTVSIAVFGTDEYMSPEQAAGLSAEVGPASDIFSLGVMLYELTSGMRPFDGESSEEVRSKIRDQEPVSIRRWNKSIPRDLETIIFKCLEKAPARRYVSAQELADDLTRFLNHEPIRARRTGLASRATKYARRNPATVAVVATVVVALLLVAGLLGAWFSDRMSGAERIASAETAKGVAVRIERQHKYAASIQHAAKALRRGSRATAMALLEDCRSVAREPTWLSVEWGLLWSEANCADHVFNAHAGAACSVRFTPDGDHLISAGEDGRVVSWNTRDWAQEWEMKTGDDEVHFAEASPDGTLLAIGHEHGRVLVIRLSDRSTVFDQPSGLKRLFAFAWLGNDRLAVAGEGAAVVVFDAITGAHRTTGPLPGGRQSEGAPQFVQEINSIAYLPRLNAFAIVAKLNESFLIDAATLQVRETWVDLPVGFSSICHIPVGEGYLAEGGWAGSVRLREISNHQIVRDQPISGTASTMRLHDACKLLLVGLRDGSVEALDVSRLDENECRRGRLLPLHNGRVLSVDFSADGAWLASAGQDGRINILKTTKLVDPIDWPLEAFPKRVLFSPCGRYLAIVSVDREQGVQISMFDGSATKLLWQTTSPELWKGRENWADLLAQWPAAFDPTGNELSVAEGVFSIRTRDSHNGEPRADFWPPSYNAICSLAYSCDDNSIFCQCVVSGTSAFDRKTRSSVEHGPFLRLATRRPGGRVLWIELPGTRHLSLRSQPNEPGFLKLQGILEKVDVLSVSNDGRFLAAGGEDHIVYCWDLEQPDSPIKFMGHEGEIVELCFAPQGDTLLSRSTDGTARFWHLATRNELLRVGSADEKILSIDVHPTGNLLVFGVGCGGRYGLRIHRLSQSADRVEVSQLNDHKSRQEKGPPEGGPKE